MTEYSGSRDISLGYAFSVTLTKELQVWFLPSY